MNIICLDMVLGQKFDLYFYKKPMNYYQGDVLHPYPIHSL